MRSSGEQKGIAMMELMIVLLGAISAGGMYGDSTGINSSQAIPNIDTEDLNASRGLEYIDKESQRLEDSVATDIMVMSMWEGSEKDVIVSLQNIGQKKVNTTVFTLVPLNKRPGSGNCFKSSNSTMWAPEEIYFCDSGLDYPKIGETTQFRVILDGSSKDWHVTCQPRTSSSSFC